MNGKTLQLGFFMVFLIGSIILFFLMSLPYISAIFLAIISAVIFRPLNNNVAKSLSGKKNLASFVSVIIVLIVIFLPLLVVGNLLFEETRSFYSEARDLQINSSALSPVTLTVENFIESRLPGVDLDLGRFLNIGPYTGRILTWLSENLTSFFSGFLRLTLGAFLYVLCLFYLFRDGQSLIKNILAWSPLFDLYDKIILTKISSTIISVLRGQLMIGLIQGVLTGVGFWIFGVPHPVVWGLVATVASLVPAIGTTLVNAPAVLYLLVIGQTLPALGLALWAIVAVGFVDNLLGPYLMNRGVKIHPFLVLISVLGGLGLFGPVGFIAGPVVLSLLFALLELYPIIVNGKVLPQN